MEIDKERLAESYFKNVRIYTPLLGQVARIILSKAVVNPFIKEELYKATNECPTLDNHINCSECQFECKLRMEPKNSTSTEIPPESLPTVIYY